MNGKIDEKEVKQTWEIITSFTQDVMIMLLSYSSWLNYFKKNLHELFSYLKL